MSCVAQVNLRNRKGGKGLDTSFTVWRVWTWFFKNQVRRSFLREISVLKLLMSAEWIWESGVAGRAASTLVMEKIQIVFCRTASWFWNQRYISRSISIGKKTSQFLCQFSVYLVTLCSLV